MEHRLAAALLCLLAATPAAAGLPDAVASRGSLVVAVVPNYPPMEFRDPATDALAGFDIELGEALARKLGLRIAWQETSFDQMMPALATGRVDAILFGMTDLATRHEAASFVDYLRSGPQFFVQQSRAPGPGMAALCGKAVGASRRTSFPKEIAAWSDAHCPGDPIRVVGTEGSGDARIQLKQGRIDAAVQGSETIPYAMSLEPGAYRAVGQPFSAVLQGIAFRKADAPFRDAVADALAALIADGSYGRIMAKWGLSGNALDAPLLNGGPRP